MKKKIYQEPTTKVVKLQHNGMVMISTTATPAATVNASWTDTDWSDGESADDGGGL